jgi:hypothetical protein
MSSPSQSLLSKYGYTVKKNIELTIEQAEIMEKLVQAQDILVNESIKWEATTGKVTQQRIAVAMSTIRMLRRSLTENKFNDLAEIVTSRPMHNLLLAVRCKSYVDEHRKLSALTETIAIRCKLRSLLSEALMSLADLARSPNKSKSVDMNPEDIYRAFMTSNTELLKEVHIDDDIADPDAPVEMAMELD